jgi:hypothetical protein
VKQPRTPVPKCRCGAWADGSIRCNGRRYCVACLEDLDDASRPPLDHAEAAPESAPKAAERGPA